MTVFPAEFYTKPLVLASQSPRRKAILQQIGLTFSIHPSEYREQNHAARKPVQVVQQQACSKAKHIADHYQNAWILGADTIVVLKEQLLGKPRNRDEAIEMLTRLSGKTHQVFTGFCMLNSHNRKSATDYEITAVTFYPLSDDVIQYYVDRYHPYDKAGAYAIQDYSAVFVSSIQGCFYNVVGFPVAKFFRFLQHELSNLL